MPKKKTVETTGNLKVPKQAAIATKPFPIEKAAANKERRIKPLAAEPPFPASFENKAGRYELIRVDGDQAYYSFTNQQKKTVDASMPVIMWRRMQERALATFKETA